MLLSSTIQQLYKPLQPTITYSENRIDYTEIAPHSLLQPFIYCYWELKTKEVLSEDYVYRVVADGCIDIFFELHQPEENFVMGFCKKFTTFQLDPSFHYIGVRFFPTMFPQLFGVDASTLSNRFEHLQHVVPKLSTYIATHFQPEQPLPEIKEKLDAYFLNQLNQSSWDNDNRLYEALDIILNKQGVLDIEKDLNTGISSRQLRRLFNYYIGDSAKTFAQVVRFQHILRAKPSIQSLKQNKLFFNAGYYDQAHFIKEFKHFYGVTPSKAFGR